MQMKGDGLSRGRFTREETCVASNNEQRLSGADLSFGVAEGEVLRDQLWKYLAQVQCHVSVNPADKVVGEVRRRVEILIESISLRHSTDVDFHGKEHGQPVELVGGHAFRRIAGHERPSPLLRRLPLPTSKHHRALLRRQWQHWLCRTRVAIASV